MEKTKPEVERFCIFCERGTAMPTLDGGEDMVICEKKGIVKADFVCRRFRYDPLKRDPKKTPPLLKTEVISLDD